MIITTELLKESEYRFCMLSYRDASNNYFTIHTFLDKRVHNVYMKITFIQRHIYSRRIVLLFKARVKIRHMLAYSFTVVWVADTRILCASEEVWKKLTTVFCFSTLFNTVSTKYKVWFNLPSVYNDNFCVCVVCCKDIFYIPMKSFSSSLWFRIVNTFVFNQMLRIY